ncbi:hypothetical protein J7406_06565 [Ruegeria sp. R8_2]|nr:hypothetical protein [Ruegeria sp. R8_1]MBO9415166.1 hypothetical protein [Ruegeria sp. R8_2]
MPFVTVDGDDIGRRLAACYLSNDVGALVSTKELVELKTQQISRLLTDIGYVNGGEKVGHGAEQKSSTAWVADALANALPNSWRLPRRLGPSGPIFSVF